MASKSTKTAAVKATKPVKSTGFIYLLYGGCMKLGFVRTGSIPNGDIEEHLESFKEHYSKAVKGRYVKTQTPDEHLVAFHEALHDHEFSEGIYEINVTQAVAALREATDVKKVSTWNVFTEEHDDHEEGEQAHGSENEQETSSAKKPASKKSAPAPTKKSAKVEVEEVEEEEDGEQEEAGEEEVEEEEEEEEEEVVEVKPKKASAPKKTESKPAKEEAKPAPKPAAKAAQSTAPAKSAAPAKKAPAKGK